LISRQVVIDLISATTTRTGLEVFAQLDERAYQRAIKVSDTELAASLVTVPRRVELRDPPHETHSYFLTSP
jgi:hypothetical protein